MYIAIHNVQYTIDSHLKYLEKLPRKWYHLKIDLKKILKMIEAERKRFLYVTKFLGLTMKNV